MSSRALIYIDYGPLKSVVTEIEKYLELLEKDPKILISTLPYIINIDIETRKNIILKLAEKWATLTASTRIVESTVSIICQYIMRTIDDRKLMLNIIKEISKIEQIEDLLIMNILLKIGTEKALPDLDLVALYEDPLSLEQGRRIGRIEIPNILVRRIASLQYTSKIMKTIRKIELEFVLCRKRVKENNIVIIDWRCLGIYPYNGLSISIDSNGNELAEPVLCAYLRHSVNISTILDNFKDSKIIVMHYRIPRTIVDKDVLDILQAVDKRLCFLCLPSSLTSRDLDVVLSFLKSIGFNIYKIVNVPVDVLLDMFHFCDT
ncbi:MAG: hypothetical protein GXO10_07375 [Crenarchaeota archaeon]|nr:hypothetical protein [Thermoproteota archaeon]